MLYNVPVREELLPSNVPSSLKDKYEVLGNVVYPRQLQFDVNGFHGS
jgi:hypothetical protein